MGTKLDGKMVAAAIKDDLALRVSRLRERGLSLGLGTVLVGEDPGSLKYVEGKHRDCAQVGIDSIQIKLPADSSQEQIMKAVEKLNHDTQCTGFIVQLPLPDTVNEGKVIERINPGKDADGMHPYNLGELVLDIEGRHLGRTCDIQFRHSGERPSVLVEPDSDATSESIPLPCTPQGVIALLEAYHIDLNGKEICVLGRGITIGRTIGLILSSRNINATVTLCHTGTRNIGEHMRKADLIVSAMGRAGFVRPEFVKKGAVLVDVGVCRTWDEQTGRYRVRGDIDSACYPFSSAYTPNPGGVGPMTRAMLLSNVVRIGEDQARRQFGDTTTHRN